MLKPQFHVAGDDNHHHHDNDNCERDDDEHIQVVESKTVYIFLSLLSFCSTLLQFTAEHLLNTKPAQWRRERTELDVKMKNE